MYVVYDILTAVLGKIKVFLRVTPFLGGCICRGLQPSNCLTLKMKARTSFETLGSINQTTQLDIPEDLNYHN
jgi:hypothetical protein